MDDDKFDVTVTLIRGNGEGIRKVELTEVSSPEGDYRQRRKAVKRIYKRLIRAFDL